MVLFVFSLEKWKQPDGGTIDSKGAELRDHGWIGYDDLQQSDFGCWIDTWEENGCRYKTQQNTQIDINGPFNGLFDNDSQQDRIFK